MDLYLIEVMEYDKAVPSYDILSVILSEYKEYNTHEKKCDVWFRLIFSLVFETICAILTRLNLSWNRLNDA